MQTVVQMIALSEGWCLLLLREFKWDVEKASDYFSNVDKYRQKINYHQQYSQPNSLLLAEKEEICDVCFA